MLAHNLIHIFCAELPLARKTLLILRWQWLVTPLFRFCLFFNRCDKNDINQCTWRLMLRLRTILSTDCVQNLLPPNHPQCAGAATFLRSKNLSFKINGLVLIEGFAHNLVHSKCAELWFH